MVFTSCEKIQDALFQPFESPISFDITIPVVNSTANEVSMGQTVVQYNLDSVIRKHTSNALGADIVGAMYINQIGIQLSNSDGNNNLGNFDYVKLSVASNGTPAVVGPLNIPAGISSSATFTITGSPDIRPYFGGSAVTFRLSGKANKATTKTLQARISATVKFDK